MNVESDEKRIEVFEKSECLEDRSPT